ncbi:fatty acid desaturase [Truncatella angustata]|uniref:Fatty acid desaturase n=1 Tax=Truncatella angustata TaxID=152316 RepID=A0A9P8UP38_9PEZI|nr:fatty acid desaturase [Truncatella angustata]KAH6655846.1 fatty acid desaturase [Truncatella angustata]
MKAYRIGRKHVGPWINMAPPIRGGIYTKEEALVEDVSDSDTDVDGANTTEDDCSGQSSHSSLTSECSSIDAQEVQQLIAKRRFNGRTDAGTAKSDASAAISMTASEYTEKCMQAEIDRDVSVYPSLNPLVQAEIIQKYRQLHQKVRDAGLYDCPFLEYGKEMARYTTIFTIFMVALRYEWYMTSAVFLGLFWHQIMFTAHDAGHGAITHIFALDTLVGLFIADFCCGLSMGWWKSSHNVHHLVTNHPEHDPDIQNVPLFATCPSFFKSIKSTYYDGFVFYWDAVADFMVPYQAYTYYPVMGIARFNLYLLSWLHVLSRKSSSLGSSKAWWIRPTEITFMACYWFLFGYCLLWRTLPTWTIRVAFVLVSHVVTMPLHVQITLSHWGMPTSDLGETESFPQRQLRTTMDVDCPAWLDFIHGGLQFQAVHHLFPRVPRHNLRKVQVFVREFCEETGIPYVILNFTDGNKKVLSRLEEVSEQVKVLVKCQKHMAVTGESGLH